MKWFFVITLSLALAGFQLWLCRKQRSWLIKAIPAAILLLALPFLLLWNIAAMGTPRLMLTALWLLIGCITMLAAEILAWCIYAGMVVVNYLKNKFCVSCKNT